MKSYSLFVATLILVSIVLFSCDSFFQKKNKYLGQLPYMIKKSNELIEEKSKKLLQTQDSLELKNIKDELESIQTNSDQQIARYILNEQFTKLIPVKSLKQTKYRIDSIKVCKVIKNELSICFHITILEDIINEYRSLDKNLFIYFRAFDKEGAIIPGSTTVATNFKRKALKKGTNCELFASWNRETLAFMTEFDGIEEITREQYDHNK